MRGHDGQLQENKVVLTEMGEFVWSLRLPDEDVFMNLPTSRHLHEAKEKGKENEDSLDKETIPEVGLGKGLAGVLNQERERGTLKETNNEWGGTHMDKKEICIERRDDYGRILTPKEAYRMLSHRFHGKGPGKKKQEKKMRKYQHKEQMKKNSDTSSILSVAERMRDAQAQLKMPYLVISRNVKAVAEQISYPTNIGPATKKPRS